MEATLIDELNGASASVAARQAEVVEGSLLNHIYRWPLALSPRWWTPISILVGLA